MRKSVVLLPIMLMACTPIVQFDEPPNTASNRNCSEIRANIDKMEHHLLSVQVRRATVNGEDLADFILLNKADGSFAEEWAKKRLGELHALAEAKHCTAK